MRIFLKTKLALLLVLLTFKPSFSPAQVFETPVEYMDYIGKANDALSLKYMVYLSSVSHGKSARKVEKRREEVVNSIQETRYNIQGMPPYKGDKSYRDSSVAYLKILNIVFNEDYGKIVNMEEIAEQSYDAMEAYVLAQEKANEKLQEASRRQSEAQKLFASKHNINLLENTSELEAKMKTSSDVLHHYNEVYLAFFKPYKQEAYLLEAVEKRNVNGVEQNLNSLEGFAEEGIEKLKKIKPYSGDPSVMNACRNMLLFYKEEAKKGTAFSDFLLKQESFEKIKKKFESTPSGKRTQKDIDEFNNAVNDINAAGDNYNKVNNELNKKRGSLLDGWNNAVKKFMDTYIPQQRKGG
ncbi:MAG: LIC11966 family surface protein [Bacteroidota bacterium]